MALKNLNIKIIASDAPSSGIPGTESKDNYPDLNNLMDQREINNFIKHELKDA